jgi:hypothetical protein
MAGPLFLRGDANDDGKVDISDAVWTLGWLFLGGSATGCVAAGNANGDSVVDISDPIYMLTHLFLGGPKLAAPYPECGPPSVLADEKLGCETQPASCKR